MRGGAGSTVSEAELHGLADGELDRDRQDAVRAYLAASPGDAARVETWRRQNEAIRSVFPLAESSHPPRPPILPGLALKRASPRWREGSFAWLIPAAFATGALFAAGLAYVASRLALPAVAPVPTAAGDTLPEKALASLREFEAPSAARQSANPSRPKPGPAVPILPALPEEDLKLAGIRALPGGQNEMLCLYYANPGGGNIALCAEKAIEEDETPARVTGDYPIAAIHWRQKGADYAIAGALPEAGLRKLADAVRSQIEAFDAR